MKISKVELFLDLKKELKPGTDTTYTEVYASGTPMEVTLTAPGPGGIGVKQPLKSDASFLNGTPRALIDLPNVEVKSGDSALWSLTANMVQLQDAVDDLVIICHYYIEAEKHP